MTSMTPRDESFRLLEQHLLDGGERRSCLNCEYYSDREPHCRQFMANPPPQVAVFACPDWVLSIPF